MKDHIDNPAGRLHAIITKTQRYSSADSASRITARQVWSEILEVENKSDTIAIYRKLGLLTDQVDKAEKLIRDIPNLDYDLYLASFPSLRVGLATPGLDAGWTNQLPHLTPVVLRDLAFCASKIAEHYSEGVIEDEELAGLTQDVSQLFEIVAQATLDPNLKELLLDLLETMRRAIAEYRIRGTEGLREALAKGVGAVVIVAQQAEKSEQSMAKRVFDLLVKVDKIVGHLGKYKPLLVAIGQRLLPGTIGDDGAAL